MKTYYDKDTKKDLIKNKWSTKVVKTIALGETVSFNGFYGDYSGKIVVDGTPYDIKFTHSKKSTAPISVRLTKPE